MVCGNAEIAQSNESEEVGTQETWIAPSVPSATAVVEKAEEAKDESAASSDPCRTTENSSIGDGTNVALSPDRTLTKEENESTSDCLLKRFTKVFTYSTKCVNLSWLMRTQSPELFLDDRLETDSKFDADRFKHYTQTGQTMDYIVWPALYLHEGGPLLQKGVAQPCSKK